MTFVLFDRRKEMRSDPLEQNCAYRISGLLTNVTCLLGMVWSLAIWAIPEGFGGPYKPGDSTDVGTALLYALMFAVLLAIAAGGTTRSING